jgi:hypothetical protein
MGQLSGVSKGISQTRLPQVTGVRQSEGHVNCVSPGSQSPLPQKVGVRQSVGQLADVSPGSQSPLPQKVMLQSIGQLKALSPISQIRFPQPGMQKGGGTGPPGSGTHGPQSLGQVSEFSPGSHRPLPHTTPTGQSRGHEAEFSVEEQIESPQKPQSCGQLEMVSGGAQKRFPQKFGPQSTEHAIGFSPNSGWHEPSPQYGLQSLGQFPNVSPRSRSQTRLPHALIVQSCGQVLRSSPTPHIPSPHLPQSTEQLAGDSPGSQRPLPQRKAGQSCGHDVVSPGSHTRLPHGVRQSMGQLAGVSPAPQTPLPQLG